jgi:hypothetical protein
MEGMADEEIAVDEPHRVLKLAAALDHPLRLKIILAHANGGPASATALAEDGLDTLGNVSYHQVRLRDLGVLKRVKTQKKRGAHEHLYDLTDFGTEVLKTAEFFGRRRK